MKIVDLKWRLKAPPKPKAKPLDYVLGFCILILFVTTNGYALARLIAG
jgi:hypothetical protein